MTPETQEELAATLRLAANSLRLIALCRAMELYGDRPRFPTSEVETAIHEAVDKLTD